MRTVISFITEDYFDYVGTSPVYSPLKRVEAILLSSGSVTAPLELSNLARS